MAHTRLPLIPNAAAFESGAKLVVVQSGTEKLVPVAALPNSGFDVTAFGAIGDGTTDDTAAIGTCFSSAPAGSAITFPPGTYLLKSPISIGVDNLTVIGQGATIISDATGQDRKFTVSGRTGIKFDGLKFNGGELTVLSTVGVVFDTYTPRTHPGTIHFSDSVRCDVINCAFAGVNWPVTMAGACEDIRVSLSRFETYFAAVYVYLSGEGTEPQGTPAPKLIKVCNNTFFTGLHPATVLSPMYWARWYPPVDVYCSGAIKFRGTLGVPFAHEFYGHVISGNTIRGSGQMGIEIQGVNECTVSGNTVENAMIGISLSWTQRAVVTGNTVKNTVFAGIEVDGRTDFDTDPTKISNDTTALTGNVIDGRDDNGRPINFVHSFGIVISHVARNVSVTGGCVKYCKTGIAINQASQKISITGVRIETNEESGNGGGGDYAEGVMPYVQGIFIADSERVDISDCVLNPSGTAWQRMINLINANSVTIRNCTVTSNNTPIYVLGGSDIIVDGCKLIMGDDIGGTNPSFVTVESSYRLCENIRIRNNVFVGEADIGVRFISPHNKVDNVVIDGNDTTSASCTGISFFYADVSGDGEAGAIGFRNNLGPVGGTVQNSFEVPLRIVAGFTQWDTPAYSEYIAGGVATINLHTAVGFTGKRKRVTYIGDDSVTIAAASGEEINGEPSLSLRNLASVDLLSDGSGWIAVYTPAMPGIQQISTAVFTSDFGTVNAGSQAYVNVTVHCPSGTSNKSGVVVGMIANLPIGVVFKQAYISGTNQATVVIHNTTGSSEAVGSVTYRLSVLEY